MVYVKKPLQSGVVCKQNLILKQGSATFSHIWAKGHVCKRWWVIFITMNPSPTSDSGGCKSETRWCIKC